MKRKAPLTHRVNLLEENQRQHELHMQKLDADISEIKRELAFLPKKDDLSELRSHIDNSINGILREALQSVPQKAMLRWTVALAVIASLSLLIPLIIKFIER